MVRSYRDLLVWQKAMDIAVACYESTRSFPRDELYGLTSQIRRAAVSVCANIAEGHSRSHRKDLLRFMEIAHGSLAELETLLLSSRLGYLSPEVVGALQDRTAEIGRMLNGLRNSLGRT